MITGFSKAGEYHNNDNTKNEDYIASEENAGYCIIALADGVSSCKKSGVGAKVSCLSLTRLLSKKGNCFFGFDKKESAQIIINQILFELKEKCLSDNGNIEDYSGTIACALYDKRNKRLFVLSLGDSLILSSDKNGCKVLAYPADSSRGCPCTTTSSAEKLVYINILENFRAEAVYIFSDGAWQKLFSGNRLREDIKKILEEKNYDELICFLNNTQSKDDQSFISINFDDKKRRKAS